MQIRYLVTSKEMKQYDQTTISYFGIPSAVLMERAALACTDEIRKRFDAGSRVLVVAGSGNNGGDGIAVGRILMQYGFPTDFVLVGNKDGCSEETARQIQIIEKYGCLVQSKIKDQEYDIIIDALFGIGLSRDVTGIYKAAVDTVNAMNAFVCGVDIPSGISADTGEIMNAAVKADITVTFSFEKPGHFLYPGSIYAGEVIKKEIGITEESFQGEKPKLYTLLVKQDEIRDMMPVRRPDGNKGTFGKLLIIAGSSYMSGACELCAGSAYRIGAGMVKVVTPEQNAAVLQIKIPEALLAVYEPDVSSEQDRQHLRQMLQKEAKWADCIIIGPGIGTGTAACIMLEEVITELENPLVIDADGLNILAASDKLKEYMSTRRKGDRPIILTPHAAEFARLYGCTTAEAKKGILHKPKELAEMWKCTVVCKDARTVTAICQDDRICLNITGNDGMATAGSGDVLAGMIGGLLAQGQSEGEAAVKGVYIHGAAGDRAAASEGRHALMAGDLIEQLKYLTVCDKHKSHHCR